MSTPTSTTLDDASLGRHVREKVAAIKEAQTTLDSLLKLREVKRADLRSIDEQIDALEQGWSPAHDALGALIGAIIAGDL